MKNRYFGWLILSALLCASCHTADEDAGAPLNSGVPIQFSAGISSLRVGRTPGAAAEVLWETQDTIGVFMQNETSGTPHAINRPYRVTTPVAAGNFVFAGTGDPDYFPFSDALSFKAYYPYKNDPAITSVTTPVQIDVSNQTQSATHKIDVLYAANNNGGAGFYYSAYPAPISLNFSHLMSKLVVNVTRGAGVTGSLSATSVKLKEMISQANVDLDAGTVAGIASTETTITARRVSGSATSGQYEAILVPHTFPSAAAVTDSIEITTTAKVYTISLLRAFSTATVSGAPSPVTAFESGKKYTLNAELTAGTGGAADYVIGATGFPWGSVSELPPAGDCEGL